MRNNASLDLWHFFSCTLEKCTRGPNRLATTPQPPVKPRALGRSRQLAGPPVSLQRRRKLAGRSALAVLLVLAVITGSLAGLTLVYSVDLPQIDELEHFRPSTTTDLYDRKGRVIGSFALERREVVDYDGLAPVLRSAVISIEDKSFESHWGVNVLRIAGALLHDLHTHGRYQGASTLTMQLARNLFLSSDRNMTRKLQEAYLAIQIERSFTKQQIFTLYANQIYLGSGMYGFEAASQFYFSKHARDLTLTEAALLAGLPKGPAAYSPVLNPDKALRRRNLVLSEMESDGVITHAQAEQARRSPLGLRVSEPQTAVAPWFQDEVRQELDKRFGAEQVHEDGLRIDTTLDLDLQQTANHAVADGVATYERRHGWKAHLDNVLDAGETLKDYRHPDWAFVSSPGDYVHALVTSVLPNQIIARAGAPGQQNADVILLPPDWQWTGQHSADSLVKPGDIVYVHLADAMEGSARRASLEEDTGAQGSLMAIDNTSGDVLAMVGGRDFALSQFNRATQAERQTGSSFKPYVYTTAVEDGVKPTDIIVDSPVNFGGYAPHNYENDYKGAMTIQNAFAESRNVPAVKLAARVGIHKVIDMAHRFGVTSNIPPYLPTALGAAEITLEEQVASYSVFPNDGLRVTPHLLRKVTNADGITLWEDRPTVNQVIDQQTARTMMILLRTVTRSGTGAAAAQLNHPVGGKTGTTSDYTDAWFLGFSPSITCGVWIGFDSRQSLGEKETGAKAALPIWMTFMRAAIADKPDEQFAGDDQTGQPLLDAKAQPPSSGPQKAVLGSPARQPRTTVATQAAPHPQATAPGATSQAAGPQKPPLRVATTAPASTPQVRPALQLQNTSGRAPTTVKPALAFPQR
jgi:penicillin-binding protein 1A